MALTPRDKRALQILGVIGGLALLFLVFLVLKGGGGGTPSASATPSFIPSIGGSPSPSLTPSPTPRQTLPPVILAGARDPFSIPPALITQSPSGGVSPSSSTTSPPPTLPPPTSPPPTSPPPTSPPPTSPPPTSPPPTSSDSIDIGGHHVVLLSVYANKKKAQIAVEGKVYTVQLSARFASNFKLVNIVDHCTDILFGDQKFTLCL